MESILGTARPGAGDPAAGYGTYVSNNLLPLGSLVYLLFCVTRYGWGWDNFLKEANTGEGMKFPGGKAFKFYLTYILPLVVLFIFVQGYVAMIK